MVGSDLEAPRCDLAADKAAYVTFDSEVDRERMGLVGHEDLKGHRCEWC